MIFISIEVKAVVSWPTYLYILDMVAFKIMLSRRFFRFLSGCCPGDQKMLSSNFFPLLNGPDFIKCNFCVIFQRPGLFASFFRFTG